MTDHLRAALEKTLRGFPGKEPRLDETATLAHGMPLETLDRVRGYQAWTHHGHWFSEDQVLQVNATRDEAAAREALGLTASHAESAPILDALTSPHQHRVALYAASGTTDLRIGLSPAGFAGWAGPSMTAAQDGSPAATEHQGSYQFISGAWDNLPKLILSWAGVSPAWLGWPPIHASWSLIETKTGISRFSGVRAGAVPAELAEDEWWLFRLSGQHSEAQPWLVTAHHGCFAITGEPEAEDVRLVQVSALTVYTEIVQYWDHAVQPLRTPGGQY